MRFVVFLILISMVNILFPQSQKISLNLEQAVKIALENNHDIKQTRLDKAKAEEKVRQTYGESVLPSVEGTASYSRAIKRPAFFLETPLFSGTFPSGTNNTLVAGIQLDQPLATGAMFLATKISETYSELAALAQQYSESELVMKVKDSYYTYLLAQEYIKLAEIQLKRAEENLKNTKSMYSVGRVSEYDQIRSNVQFQNSIPVLTEAKNQLALAENNLKILLGLELNNELVINDRLSLNKVDLLKENDGIAKLNESNSMLKQSITQTKLNELSASYQYSQHYPELRAFGNWQMQSQENDDRSFTNWRFINSITIGLNLRIPIFKGFSIDSKYEQAKIDYDKSIEALAKTKKELRKDYENTILSIQKALDLIESYQSSVDETERGYQIALKRYSSGLSSQIEITDALLLTSQAKYNYANSVYTYNVLLARLDLLLGKSLAEIIN